MNARQSSTQTRHDESSGQRGLENEIIALEHKYWGAWKNKDAKTLAQIRAENFRESDPNGVLNKKQAEEGEPDMEITSYALKNEKVSLLQPDVAMLTYEVAYKASYKGADISSPHAYVSSVYVRQDYNWRLVYSQETAAKGSDERLCRQDTTAASGERESDLLNQALAKEREILETVKRNDWHGFSDLLADDVVAINEDGIVGKKELIDGIKADGTIFSDYKMENIKVIPQGNGAVVAYRETLVGTQNGKPFAWHINTHSHWERRGGKWLMTMFQDSMAKEQK